ncbi:MAG: hypothetical protein EOO16_05550 [Chitinophagaceae bacterium]|nr:MAG: hypothetical protein EOO16_05550 [Chitinophagaceae bacterium]
MKQLLLSGVALAVLTFTSCKKNSDEAAPGNGTVTTPSLRLKKMVQTFSGATRTVNFSYDNTGKLSGYESSDNVDHTSFAYDNDGNLTTIDETEDGFHNMYVYTYQNGKPVSAIFKSWRITAGQPNQLIEDDELTYTVANNRVSKIHVRFEDNSERDFELAYDGNGELAQVNTIGSADYLATFTYGDKKSPFPAVSKWVLDQAGFSNDFVTKRNILTRTFDFPGTAFDQTQTTTYTFNASGYPATASSGGVQTTFEYQQL